MHKGALYKCSHPKSDMSSLTQALQEIVDELKPSSEEQTRQAHALQQVPFCLSLHLAFLLH